MSEWNAEPSGAPVLRRGVLSCLPALSPRAGRPRASGLNPAFCPQGGTEELSPAALEKRRRRKQERDRRKRKRKELRAKEKAAKAAEATPPPPPPPPSKAPGPDAGPQPGLLFNKVGRGRRRGRARGRGWRERVRGADGHLPQVEVSAEPPASRAQRRREKRQKLKGNLTPLTGRNYRQLLERLQARQSRLEQLRERDAGQARELEAKMRWTDALYKAEGVKVRDDQHLLQAALQRKEKRRAQRQRRWEKRTAHVVDKMQRRQDQRRQNLRRKKVAKAERRREKARRKGRILPQDLQRAGLA